MKQILHAGPGIVIGLPTLGRPVPLDWAMAFKALNAPINYNTVFQILHGSEIGLARQVIAEYAVSNDAKYLFFLGDDVVVPAHTLRQLIYRMEQDPAIAVVGGVYCAKATPAYPLVFRGNGQGCYWDWKIGEFFEVSGMGMDCTLIRVEALKKLSKPWFKTVDKDQYLDNINTAEMWTEDLFFFKKLADELPDTKVYIDAGVICEHWDVYGNKKYNLPKDSLPMRQLVMPVQTKRCLQIGATIPLKDEDYFIVKFGDKEDADYRGQASQLPFEKESFERVVITDQGLDFHLFLDEWLRVLKFGYKLSIHFKPLISLIDVKQWIEFNKNLPTAIDGEFVEIAKLKPEDS